MTDHRSSFLVRTRRDDALRRRLVWRQPLAHPQARAAFAAALDEWIREHGAAPAQITVGEYTWIEYDAQTRAYGGPAGRWAFAPQARSALAMRALRVDSVRDRIAEDLCELNGVPHADG